MRIFAIPATYATTLEADVSRTIEEVRIDMFRRANGHAPSIPDWFLDEKEKGTVFVVVGVASDRLFSAVAKAAELAREEEQRAKKATA